MSTSDIIISAVGVFFLVSVAVVIHTAFKVYVLIRGETNADKKQ